jgi:2',3'-cyclic-nucleotide 2'-phosphodiesterase
VRLLFIGDIFAAAGRRIVEERLAALRADHEVDLVVANAENVADGVGITSRLARRLLTAGVDVITLGNHAYRQREVLPFLGTEPRVIRPANLPAASPGVGLAVVTARDGTRVAVVNLLGKLFLDPAVSPFEMVEGLVERARAAAPVVLVDFHAEATSEKIALARLLAGRVTAVIGTHTHVQTNDATVLDGATAYITDAGMTGPHDSVIGVRTELVLQRMTTGLPIRFEPAEGDVRLEGVVVDCDPDGRARSIEPLRLTER